MRDFFLNSKPFLRLPHVKNLLQGAPSTLATPLLYSVTASLELLLSVKFNIAYTDTAYEKKQKILKIIDLIKNELDIVQRTLLNVVYLSENINQDSKICTQIAVALQ